MFCSGIGATVRHQNVEADSVVQFSELPSSQIVYGQTTILALPDPFQPLPLKM